MKKITKILSLGILFLLVCTLHSSAQKCKFEYNKTDPITGENTKGNKFKVNGSWDMGFNRIGNTYYASMEYDIRGELKDILQTNDPIIIKLSNGEIITLTAQEECVPAYKNVWAAGWYTYWNGKYSINASSIKSIAENPPVFARMNIGNKVYEQQIPTKDGKAISEAAKCILQ